MADPGDLHARIAELEAQLTQFQRSEADVLQARKDLESRFGQLLMVQMFTRESLECRSLSRLLEHLLENAVAILSAESGAIWKSEDGEHFHLAATCNLEAPDEMNLDPATIRTDIDLFDFAPVPEAVQGQLGRELGDVCWIPIRLPQQASSLILMLGIPEDKRRFYPPLRDIDPGICRLFKQQAEAVYAYFHELEQRKLSDVEAQKSGAYYQSIFENAPLPLVQIDASQVRQFLQSISPDGTPSVRGSLAALAGIRLKRANLASAEFYGSTNWRRIVYLLKQTNQRSLLRSFLKCHQQLLTNQRAVVDGMQWTQTGKRLVEFHITVMPGDEDWENLVVAILDKTQSIEAEHIRQELEKRVKRTEKMEALGMLAGGVAHDLNNVLVSLVGLPDMLMEEVRDRPSAYEMSETIRDAGLQASAFVQDLLTMARRGLQSQTTLDINKEIQRYVDSRQFEVLRDARPGVDFQLELSVDSLGVMGSAVHLSKVFMNVVTNGFEAMGDSGGFVIRSQAVDLDSPAMGYEEIPAGCYARIDFEDNGSGIAAEHLPHIFEPFYTRKTMGQTSGTGLGMAVVWGVIRDHNAYIDVTTQPEVGTRFSFYFPMISQGKYEGANEQTVLKASTAHEMILVVDDMPMQRKVLNRLLKRYGYQVHCVESGELAVEWLRQHHADMVLLDMIMNPGVDGLTTFEEILSFKPEQPAILVSGYAATERVERALELGVRTFVKKPFRPAELIQTLQIELGRTASQNT